MQKAIATPERQANYRPGSVRESGDSHRFCKQRGDRSHYEAGRSRAQEASSDEQSRIEKERPDAIPVAMGITDGDYRFTPDGPGDEPAPGKGIKELSEGGKFSPHRSGRYKTPPSYFLIRGDINSHGSEDAARFRYRRNSGQSADRDPPAQSGRTSGRRRAWRNGCLALTIH